MQLDMFSNQDIQVLKEEVLAVKKSSDAVRRGIFARHGELAKMYLEQKAEIDKIKDLLYGKEESNVLQIQNFG